MLKNVTRQHPKARPVVLGIAQLAPTVGKAELRAEKAVVLGREHVVVRHRPKLLIG
jgi:hypothetical protein